MFSILYGFLAALARLSVRSGRSKDLEIIVLHHENAVLRRKGARPTLSNDDRTLLGASAAALPQGHPPDADTTLDPRLFTNLPAGFSPGDPHSLSLFITP